MGLTPVDGDPRAPTKVAASYMKALSRRETSFALNAETFKTLDKWAKSRKKHEDYYFSPHVFDK